jgi:uncharacterized protein with ATP-grasp and redox domains
MELTAFDYLSPQDKNSFAYFTVTQRFPKIIQEIINSGLYPQSINESLQTLLRDLPTAKVRDLNLTSAERPLWKNFLNQYSGQQLFSIPFFYGEVYLYRLILEVTKYLENQIDPFSVLKEKDVVDNEAFFKKILDEPFTDRLKDYLLLSLTGNRADLSQIHFDRLADLTLLVDDSQELADILPSKKNVHIILDNSGVELFSDLIMAEAFVRSGKINNVILHSKALPIFVSDTTNRDIDFLLQFLLEKINSDRVTQLVGFIKSGKIRIIENIFWNTPNHFSELAKDLNNIIGSDDLCLSKGDANYRRFFEDRNIPFHYRPQEFTQYLAFTTVALRTLKSEIVLGLEEGTADKLTSIDSKWLFNGKYAVIQKVN